MDEKKSKELDAVTKGKKKRAFPSAYTVLFIILILAALVTWVSETGAYSKMVYNVDSDMFEVTDSSGEVEEMPATQESLDKLDINANLDKFLDESIYKPVAVPGTYEEIESNPQGIAEIIMAPINGVYETIDIALFVFIIGGMIGLLNYTGTFAAGLGSLSKATKGKEHLLIILVTFLVALGGTTFGMCEETIAFYPVIIPIFVIAGYDALVGIAAVYVGSQIGCMASTVNPFSVVIASNAAGVNFMEGFGLRVVALIIGTIIVTIYILRYAKKVKADPSKSYILESKEYIEHKFCSTEEAPALTGRGKIALLLFFATFVIMVYGVTQLDWWFGEMAALFLVSAIIIGIVLGLSEREIASGFIDGASEMMGVALVVGVARAVNLVLDAGLVSDALLHAMTGWVDGMSPSVFIILMFFIFIILGFFINSTSGLAVLSIPIMAPLADAAGMPRETVITAYIFGQGMMSFITPTGLILVVLELVHVNYDKYLKFMMPLFGILCVFAIVMLLIEAQIAVL
ncbi:MAG: YfcC family protein [Peptostreptococcaceae bacterium]|nr:YfcC family protein [Peptostreptococcaceae bacterium]